MGTGSHAQPDTPAVDSVGTGRYECPACPQRFETVGDKKRHLKEDHK